MRGLSVLLLVTLSVIVGISACRAQAPPNPAAENYRHLYIEMSDRLVALAVQATALEAQIKALTKQLEDAKKSVEGKP